MKKLNRKPVYSAKPGECENVVVKDYSKQAVADTGWIKNVLTNVEERTTVEKEGDRFNVQIEMRGGLFLPPVEQPQGVLNYNGRGSGKTRRND